MDMMWYISSDPHREFSHIEQFCEMQKTTREDVLILLGDVLINYYEDRSDTAIKERLAQLPITLFCLKGNHEQRPENMSVYELVPFAGGEAYREQKYPNLLFAKDAEVYTLAGKQCMTIGGAYSLNWQECLTDGTPWWEDEQPTAEIRAAVEARLKSMGYRIDRMLTHTCPLRYAPMKEFAKDFDWEGVDTSTEQWLDEIEQKLEYELWYCGHFHRSQTIDKLQFVYTGIQEFK